MSLWTDILGTTKSLFQISIGGVKLGNSSGNLTVKDDSNADSEITVSKANVSGDGVVLNSDAAESGADWKLNLNRPAAGMTADLTLTLPVGPGSPDQVLSTDGNGNMAWATPTSLNPLLTTDTTTVNFDSISPVAMFNAPVGSVIEQVRVVIDTPFDGTAPTMSIGVAGTASKYMASTQNNLKGTAADVYGSDPGLTAVSGSPEALIATLAPDSSSEGSVRVIVTYSIPS